jgi:hypothetical protein
MDQKWQQPTTQASNNPGCFNQSRTEARAVHTGAENGTEDHHQKTATGTQQHIRQEEFLMQSKKTQANLQQCLCGAQTELLQKFQAGAVHGSGISW